MIDRNAEREVDSEEEALPVASLRAPVVLDDSDYAIPDEWGLKEAYNDQESVVNHRDTLYIAGTHSLRDVMDDRLLVVVGLFQAPFIRDSVVAVV